MIEKIIDGIQLPNDTTVYKFPFAKNIKDGNAEGSVRTINAGRYDTVDGKNAFAEGDGTKATGICSHAEGYCTKAAEYSAHSEGYFSEAQKSYSHAEGRETIASGYASHTEGEGTTAEGFHQHVQGKFNIADSKKAHIVGNGTSADVRSNAHTLDWDGNAWYAGDVLAGGQNAEDSAAISLKNHGHTADKIKFTDGQTFQDKLNNGSLKGDPNERLKETDTRSDNQIPNWYLTKYGKSIITEFKYCNAVGVNSVLAGTYCNVTTITPWGDSSGGMPVQFAVNDSDGGVGACRRSNADGTGWTPWEKLVTESTVKKAVANSWKTVRGTLTTGGWSGRYQSISCPGLAANSIVFASADGDNTNSVNTWNTSNIWACTQSAGTLNFYYYGEAPAYDVKVVICYMVGA